MKVTVNVECSPEEARQFMGLPDVRPMQDALMKEVEKRITASMQIMDPEAMMRLWMPGTQHMEQLQQLFWSQMKQNLSGVANMISYFGERKAVK